VRESESRLTVTLMDKVHFHEENFFSFRHKLCHEILHFQWMKERESGREREKKHTKHGRRKSELFHLRK
jgi:hypothetical protein